MLEGGGVGVDRSGRGFDGEVTCLYPSLWDAALPRCTAIFSVEEQLCMQVRCAAARCAAATPACFALQSLAWKRSCICKSDAPCHTKAGSTPLNSTSIGETTEAQPLSTGSRVLRQEDIRAFHM
jgi:hypothetical protein